jgi:outer membrane protein OmpA-like peptidoglycan-associated protein
MYLYQRNAPGLSGAFASGFGEPADASPTTQQVKPPRAMPIFSEFEFAKATLNDGMKTQIAQLADQIVRSWRGAVPIRRVVLVGHTDDAASPDFNLKLGTARADAVKAKLAADLAGRMRTLSSSIDRRITIETETRGLTQPITSDRARRSLNRRVETFVYSSMLKKQVPPPPPPVITGQRPPQHPTYTPPPDPVVIPWPQWKPRLPQAPTWDLSKWWPKGAPPPSGGGSGSGSGIADYIKTSMMAGAGALGIVYSGSVWVIRGITLEKAIEAAWIAIQIETGGFRAAVGAAGEAVLEAVLPDVLRIDPSRVLNLNNKVANFPILDLISARGVYVVKTYAVVSSKFGAELLDQVVSKYKNDFFAMIFDQGPRDTRMDDCVKYLFEHQADLRRDGQWPTSWRGTTEQSIRKYVQQEGMMVIPKDHVQPARRALGKHLNEMRVSGKLRGVDVEWIQKQIFRIDHAGLTTKDLGGLVEATQHLPAKVYEKYHQEHDQLIRARRARARRQP